MQSYQKKENTNEKSVCDVSKYHAIGNKSLLCNYLYVRLIQDTEVYNQYY